MASCASLPPGVLSVLARLVSPLLLVAGAIVRSETRESGLPGYVVESWNALSGPAGMPDDIVRLLNRAVNEVLQMPEVQEKAKTLK